MAELCENQPEDESCSRTRLLIADCLRPRTLAQKRAVTYPKIANLWRADMCQPIGRPWLVYLRLTVIVLVRDHRRYAEQMQMLKNKSDTWC